MHTAVTVDSDPGDIGLQPLASHVETSLSGSAAYPSHLSNASACMALHKIANEELSNHRRNLDGKTDMKAFLLSPDKAIAVLCALILVAFYISALLLSNPYQGRASWALFEAGILLLFLLWNIWLFRREQRLTSHEMTTRLQAIADQLQTLTINDRSNYKIPTTIPTVSVARVVRDNQIFILPHNMLCEGDIVLMAFGDISPGTLKYSSSSGTYTLLPGDIFKPEIFGVPSGQIDHSVFVAMAQQKGYLGFRLSDTPLRTTIRQALGHSRPATVLTGQLVSLKKILEQKVLWIILVISFIINITRFSLLGRGPGGYYYSAIVEYVFVFQVYAILPFLPMSIMGLVLIARSFGNAQLLSVLEALQTSKVQFEDEDDVDEFDAAPPPMKELDYDWGQIWRRFVDQLVRVDISFLARTTGLVETLANITVICTIDREGTISQTFPSIEKLFFMADGGEAVTLKIAEDPAAEFGIKFEDRDWRKYSSNLKAMGLEFLLNTECTNLYGKTRLDNHRKSSNRDGKVPPASQTCLCRLAKEIGFKSNVSAQYRLKKTIMQQCPFQAHLKLDNLYHYDIPVTTTRFYEVESNNAIQDFSEGDLFLILNSCSDYWNGDKILAMDETVEKRILDFYQKSIIGDMKVVAYSYSPLLSDHQYVQDTMWPGLLIMTEDFYPFEERSSMASAIESPMMGPSDLNQSGTDMPSLPVDPLVKTIHDYRKDRGRFRGYKSVHSQAPPRRPSEINRSAKNLADEYEGFINESVFKDRTFLCMAGFSCRPKPDVVSIIEDLGLAGIRFVYFSSAPERESKAYAERLGLEIDWNSCILLSPATEGVGYLELHDIKARLPRGVENIRPHIRTVDDIPLHVSLFAECTPPSITEMVRIFQENGDVVCCIGSSLNEMNVECFAMADISVSIDPLSLNKMRGGGNSQTALHLGAAFTSAPCALTLNHDVSLYTLTQLIHEARTLAENARQGFSFHIGCQVALSLMIQLSYIVLLPPIFTGYQIMWMVWVILPILCFSFLFTPPDPEIMTHMPVKNTALLKDKMRFTYYYIVRFAVPVLTCIALYALTLQSLQGGPSLVLGTFGLDLMQMSVAEQWALLYAQNVALFFAVFYFVIISFTYLQRTLPSLSKTKQFKPIDKWMIAAAVCLVLQIAFTAISLFSGPRSLSELPWYIWVLGFASPVVFVPIQEAMKVHDKKEWDKFQKRSKLEFNTKLGMHSPL
ncbi:uncharacterized protein BJ171DRAFT_276649 [Polychytrium aggregatum]|uniref:uncharacterized protein n=1 Tax=Polychytrium aggregatum TaxID=110093 RepID=UPI0022FE3126|nr:uncharacterized protein BJ171DRAFT_276649 [Polychytrium aggregatum]KAI9207507.1 hypothetical protein BJ171DRAFT_276649 [Polychytrium aggregatum]